MLPFGLSSAPYLFTRLFKPLIKEWRSEAKGIVVYLNDGLGSAAGSPTPRLLVWRFTLNCAVPVFSLTNPNQSRNRLRLSFGLGSLSICLVHESPPLTNGLSACWTFWISSVDVFCWYPGALAVSFRPRVWMSCFS